MAARVKKTQEAVSESLRTDPNWNRLRSWVDPVSRRLPSATVDYLTEKLPVAQWLPYYDYRWLLQDVIAGITIGVMFIPQGLAYAKIATIPVEHGLYSSWLPSAIYFFLGTSKELSTGPTSILGLLTAEVVADIARDGHSPAQVASAVAFMAGVYSLAVGLLKLGFLLDFVSAAVLTGWISAVALVILLGQVDSLIGMDVPSGTAEIIRGILGNLHEIQPMTLMIGFLSIFLLVVLEKVGKKWGKKSIYIKIIGTSRAVIVLVLFTLVSYLSNLGRDEDNYRWEVTQVDTHGLLAPRAPQSSLLQKVVARSFAPFIAMAVEHLGVGKAFGLKNNYQIDKSQELVFLGVENILNSLFGAMTTGGAMSRTAVNSECNVRTPLNFLFTAAFIILTIYELAPALYWIPKATLSAIIIMAVVHLISPPRLFYRYWRMSFLDFVASMLGFWVTLFTSTEIGLATAVGFSIVITLLRLAFPSWIGVTHSDTEDQHMFVPTHTSTDQLEVPPEAYLVRFTQDILFPNAERVKSSIIESVKLHYEQPSSVVQDKKSVDRMWNTSGHKMILRTRKRKGITPIAAQLSHVVLDFGTVSFIDVTGVLTLIELKMELRRYVGKELQFRFVNMTAPVRERFDRSEWIFALDGEERSAEADTIYSSLELAILHREGDDKYDSNGNEKTSNEKVMEV
jgi:sodium-independent sulfate anion transporter 11